MQNNTSRAPECEDIWSVVVALFRHATPGIWWRLLPENNKNDDISYATSVDWENTCPLLIYVKILEKKVVLGVEKLFVMKEALDTLVDKMGRKKIHISIYRPPHSKQAFYFCVGQPLYSKVKECARMVASELAPGPPGMTDDKLRKKCRLASDVLREHQIEHVRPANEQENLHLLANAVLEQEQEQEIFAVPLSREDEIENAITYALALAFERVPRYVRQSDDKITLALLQGPRSRKILTEESL